MRIAVTQIGGSRAAMIPMTDNCSDRGDTGMTRDERATSRIIENDMSKMARKVYFLLGPLDEGEGSEMKGLNGS